MTVPVPPCGHLVLMPGCPHCEGRADAADAANLAAFTAAVPPPEKTGTLVTVPPGWPVTAPSYDDMLKAAEKVGRKWAEEYERRALEAIGGVTSQPYFNPDAVSTRTALNDAGPVAPPPGFLVTDLDVKECDVVPLPAVPCPDPVVPETWTWTVTPSGGEAVDAAHLEPLHIGEPVTVEVAFDSATFEPGFGFTGSITGPDGKTRHYVAGDETVVVYTAAGHPHTLAPEDADWFFPARRWHPRPPHVLVVEDDLWHVEVRADGGLGLKFMGLSAGVPQEGVVEYVVFQGVHFMPGNTLVVTGGAWHQGPGALVYHGVLGVTPASLVVENSQRIAVVVPHSAFRAGRAVNMSKFIVGERDWLRCNDPAALHVFLRGMGWYDGRRWRLLVESLAPMADTSVPDLWVERMLRHVSPGMSWAWQPFVTKHPERCAKIVKDVVGNPFRPVLFDAGDDDTVALRQELGGKAVLLDPALLLAHNGLVLTVAAGIKERTAYHEVAILHDVLAEVGCALPDVLRHCEGYERCPECLGTGTTKVRRPVGTRAVDEWLGEPSVVGPTELVDDECLVCNKRGWVDARCEHTAGCWLLDLLTMGGADVPLPNDDDQAADDDRR